MKPINTKNLNQNEAQIAAAKLGLHAAHLRGLLALAESETVAPPTLIKGDDLGNIQLLVSHISELEHRLDGNAPAFELSVASVARSDGNKQQRQSLSVRHDKMADAAAKPNLTEQVLKARGVKTLAELNALPLRDVGD